MKKRTTGPEKPIKLTAMQSFFLDFINKSDEEVNPCYLANVYYESIGRRRYAASRDSFGQTSAAYRTCRFLAAQKLIREHHHRGTGGYSYTTYSRIEKTK